MLGAERQVAELLYRQVEAAGLLVEEGAGPGGADGVHREVADYGPAGLLVLAHDDELRVLAADLDDGVDVRVEPAHRGGLRDYFIYEGRARNIGRQLAARAGEAQRLYLVGWVAA